MAWSVCFGLQWKRLCWVDMIGSRFIWLVGKEAEGQSGLSGVSWGKVDSPSPQSQWLCCNSKISGGDYRLLRRIQQLSHSRTDFIKSAKLVVTLLVTQLAAIYVTCDRYDVTCDICHMWSACHMWRSQAPCLCRTFVQALLGCWLHILASELQQSADKI